MRVIDASAIAKYLLHEEGWGEVEQYLKDDCRTLPLALKEVANAIWKRVKLRGDIDEELACELLQALQKLLSDVVKMEDQEKYIMKAFEIALRNNVTIYDSLYIAAALGGELVTSDKRQAEVAEKLGIIVRLVV